MFAYTQILTAKCVDSNEAIAVVFAIFDWLKASCEPNVEVRIITNPNPTRIPIISSFKSFRIDVTYYKKVSVHSVPRFPRWVFSLSVALPVFVV